MLSDALFDFVQEAKDYQRDYPNIYCRGKMKKKVERIIRMADELREELDYPPRFFPERYKKKQ